GVLYGIKPAVVAIVLQAAWRIGARALKHPLLWLIAAAAFVAIFALHVPFPLIVVTAGIIGAIGGRFLPAAFAPTNRHAASRAAHAPALIDDTTPTPRHARYSRAGLLRDGRACVLLGPAAVAAPVVQGGVEGTLEE